MSLKFIAIAFITLGIGIFVIKWLANFPPTAKIPTYLKIVFFIFGALLIIAALLKSGYQIHITP